MGGKKYEDLCPTSHNLEVPFVKKTEYQLLNIEADQSVELLIADTGETKKDLNMPSGTDDDDKLNKEIGEAFESGKTVILTVQLACKKEKIIGMKTEGSICSGDHWTQPKVPQGTLENLQR